MRFDTGKELLEACAAGGCSAGAAMLRREQALSGEKAGALRKR